MDILGILRAVFGLFFLFVVPGYALVWALFPKKEELSWEERIALTFVLSIASDILVTLIIDLVFHLPTTPWNIFISLVFFTLICAVVYKLQVLYYEGKLKIKRKGNADS